MFFSDNFSRFSAVALSLSRASSSLLLFNNQIIFAPFVFVQMLVNTVFVISVPTLEKSDFSVFFKRFHNFKRLPLKQNKEKICRNSAIINR
jgi:hypothetical protein